MSIHGGQQFPFSSVAFPPINPTMRAAGRLWNKLRSGFEGLLQLGLRPGLDAPLIKCIELSNFICLVFSFCMLSFTVLFSLRDLHPLTAISAIWFLVSCSFLLMNKMGHYTVSRLGLVVWTDVVGFLVCWLLGKESHFHTGYFAVVGTPLVIFRPSEKNFILMGILLPIACYFGLEFMPARFADPLSISSETSRISRLVIDITVFLVIVSTILYFYVANSRSEGRLEDTIKQLEISNWQINENLNKLQEAQMMLMQSGKMAALGEMAGGIAHEINNPLAIIRALSSDIEEIVMDEPIDKAFVKDTASKLVKTADRIAKIVQGLKSFSRDGSRDAYEQVSVHALIEETLSFCKERFKNYGTDLVVENFDRNLQFEGRPTEISQVILNLLNNSQDAIAEFEEKWVKISVLDGGSWVEIQITDSGKGIPPDARNQIFQPFFTTKEIGKGTGMGLSISLGIVRAHHGELRLDARCPNTRFVIRLPKKQGSMASAA